MLGVFDFLCVFQMFLISKNSQIGHCQQFCFWLLNNIIYSTRRTWTWTSCNCSVNYSKIVLLQSFIHLICVYCKYGCGYFIIIIENNNKKDVHICTFFPALPLLVQKIVVKKFIQFIFKNIGTVSGFSSFCSDL